MTHDEWAHADDGPSMSGADESTVVNTNDFAAPSQPTAEPFGEGEERWFTGGQQAAAAGGAGPDDDLVPELPNVFPDHDNLGGAEAAPAAAAAAAAAAADADNAGPRRRSAGAGAAAPGEAPVAEAEELHVEKWSTRTKKTLGYMRKYMGDAPSTSFRQLVRGRRRGDAAGAFFEMLALKSHSCVELAQDEPYGDITISRGKFFGTAAV